VPAARDLVVTRESLVNRASFAERHPYWFVAILELVIILVYLVAGTVAHFRGMGGLWLYGFANFALTVIGAAFLTRMRWWNRAGFRRLERTGDLRYYAIPLIPAVLNLVPGVEASSLVSVLGFLALALMVGFVEEVFFRGLMLQALRSKGIWKTAVITALVFGLTHLMNGLAGRDLLDLGTQVAYTLTIGFAFTAIVIRKGVIWPLVVSHATIDFVAFLRPVGYVATPEYMLVTSLVVTAIFLVYGLALMLGGKEPDGKAVRRVGKGSSA
jgi:membrane protease YdiL (CAAX protease family)